MENIQIRQGETFIINLTSEDETADTLRIVVRKVNANGTMGTIIIDETASFSTVSGKRIATISTDDTNHTPDNYSYMLIVTYADGTVKKFPDSDCDDDGCDFPVFSICAALDLEVS